MIDQVLEILLPAKHDVPDEEAFKAIESRTLDLGINQPNRKRILVIAMELFQNLKRHANHQHLALLRIRQLRSGGFQITSLNFAGSESTSRLQGKHSELMGCADYRQLFKQKLEKKISGNEVPGNLGLELCFRSASTSSLRMLPFSRDLSLIYLSFSLDNHGKIHS